MSTKVIVFDGFLTVSGRSLEVVHVPAPRGAPTIVFIHEGLGSIALWRDFPQSLARAAGCGYLVYSRYGNGKSDTLQQPREVPYMHEEAQNVLPALLDACEIERPVLFGHSDGASIALIYAGTYPSKVSALILEAPHLFVETLSVDSISEIRKTYKEGPLRERMANYHRDVDRTFYGWNDIWLDPRFASWNIEDRVDNVVAPVLAIQGIDDAYGTLAQLDVLARRSRGRVDRFVLSACGHAPHRARSLAVEDTARRWLGNTLLTDY